VVATIEDSTFVRYKNSPAGSAFQTLCAFASSAILDYVSMIRFAIIWAVSIPAKGAG